MPEMSRVVRGDAADIERDRVGAGAERDDRATPRVVEPEHSP